MVQEVEQVAEQAVFLMLDLMFILGVVLKCGLHQLLTRISSRIIGLPSNSTVVAAGALLATREEVMAEVAALADKTGIKAREGVAMEDTAAVRTTRLLMRSTTRTSTLNLKRQFLNNKSTCNRGSSDTQLFLAFPMDPVRAHSYTESAIHLRSNFTVSYIL